jgi:hypothetical protein
MPKKGGQIYGSTLLLQRKGTFSLHVNYVLVRCWLVTDRALLRRSHKGIRTCLADEVRAVPQNYWTNDRMVHVTKGIRDIDVRAKVCGVRKLLLA